MQCPNCSEFIQSGADSCPHCGHKVAVTVLSKQERDNFNGITIEDNSNNERERYDYEAGGSPRIKQYSFSFGSLGLFGNLFVVAIIAAILFFFLPILVVTLLIIGVAVTAFWVLRRLLR